MDARVDSKVALQGAGTWFKFVHDPSNRQNQKAGGAFAGNVAH
jgi:hypothetical protein